jgi:hypothetical protein
MEAVADFFSAPVFFAKTKNAHARIVTSVAMFYDLEAPLTFAKNVHDVLAEGGVWHFEQSYVRRMLDATSYDTICHEHLEYYALRQIVWICDRTGFRIVDVTENDVNGGSFAVTAVKDASKGAHAPIVGEMLAEEARLGFDRAAPYTAFAERVARHRDELRDLVRRLSADGRKVFGLGASTKGNVILQYCGFDEKDIPFVAEVNEDKFGAFTPGTRIPIISEKDAYAKKPDVLLVLPWHFRAGLLRAAEPFLKGGGKMLFPLPRIELVPA